MTRRKLCSFGLLLALVLLGHTLALCWLYERTQGLKPLIPMADPMLTRIIEPAPSPVPVQRHKFRHARSALASTVTAAPQADAATQTGAATDQSSPDLTDPPGSDGPEQSEPAPPAAAVLADEASTGDSWPADTRVSYALKGYYRGDLHGSARVQWQREQSRYQVRLDLIMALVMQLSMTSQGEVGPASLVPRIYEEKLPWSLRRMVFEGDWVRFDNGVQLPQPPNLQDTVSQFVELSHRFSSGREVLKVGGQVSLWLARPQGMAFWTYDVVDEEILQTPELGAVSAFHLRPRPITNPSGVITAEMWFAPSLQYLPVRVRIALGADNFVDLLVERIEQGVAPVTPVMPKDNWRDGP